MESGVMGPAVIPLTLIVSGIVWNTACYMIAGRPEPSTPRADRLRLVGWIGYGLALAVAAALFVIRWW